MIYLLGISVIGFCVALHVSILIGFILLWLGFEILIIKAINMGVDSSYETQIRRGQESARQLRAHNEGVVPSKENGTCGEDKEET